MRKNELLWLFVGAVPAFIADSIRIKLKRGSSANQPIKFARGTKFTYPTPFEGIAKNILAPKFQFWRY